MTAEDIYNKIKLYNNAYVKGEVRSKEYETRLKQTKALHAKKDLADTMFNDLPFSFAPYQKQQVKQLITENKNFKKLHGNASNEEIILSLIFFVKMQEDDTIRIDKNKRLLNKYNINIEKYHNTYEIILCRLLHKILANTPITPTEPKNVDHNILYKGKIR